MWLGADELQALINEAQTLQQRVAFLLAGRCGLRRSELIQVRSADFVSRPTGHTCAYRWTTTREPPVLDELKNIVDTLTFSG